MFNRRRRILSMEEWLSVCVRFMMNFPANSKVWDNMNLFVLLRFFVGILFVVSGFEKLIHPYQNFMYVIEGYDFMPPELAEWTARLMPWMELFLGVFLVLGLWIEKMLNGTLALVTLFISVVAQALIRKLPIDECGCFGELFSLPLPAVILFDSVVWFIILNLLIRIDKTRSWSLDQYFMKK